MHFLQHRGQPGIYTSLPLDEATASREVRRFTQRGPAFEDFRPISSSASRRAKVLAYYLPQFHCIPENDKWWGKGFTEWTNLARGQPRFVGHYQPRIPRDLGFYNLNNSEVIHRQIEMARGAGLFGFVLYMYWFNGRRLLEGPLDRFANDSSLEFPFCLMWANENWTRRWDGSDSEILISQDYAIGDEESLIAAFAGYFKDPPVHPVGRSASFDDISPAIDTRRGEDRCPLARAISFSLPRGPHNSQRAMFRR